MQLVTGPAEPTQEELDAAQDREWSINQPPPCFEPNFSTRKKQKISAWQSSENTKPDASGVKVTDEAKEDVVSSAQPIMGSGFSFKMSAKAKPKFGSSKPGFR